MIKKLALFNTPQGTTWACEENTEKYNFDYVRVSEYVEVEFPALSLEARQAQLIKLEAARTAATNYYQRELANIQKRAESLQS